MAIRDDNENISLFEPLMVSQGSKYRQPLNDLALELAERSAAFKSSLPVSLSIALSSLIRSMNCYYSNLIEGHNTHPIDIERALKDDYVTDAKQRNLQREAKAHIAVQQWIDEGGVVGSPLELDNIKKIHRRFYENLPAEFLSVDDPVSGKQLLIVAGELRQRDVKVGRHVAISPAAVPRFLTRLHQAYTHSSRIELILATACAHHRLLWIHPFLDGNGRVARLISYAMLRTLLKTDGLWSIARGLARNEQAYKNHLAICDQPRRGDMDGRGALSEAALADFVEFFLTTSIDQIRFIQELMQPDRLRDRIMIWTEEEIRAKRLPAKSDHVLRAILFQGEISRAEVVALLGISERAARRITSALLQAGAINSDSTRAPLKLAMPAKFANRWMPGLFPEQ